MPDGVRGAGPEHGGGGCRWRGWRPPGGPNSAAAVPTGSTRLGGGRERRRGTFREGEFEAGGSGDGADLDIRWGRCL